MLQPLQSAAATAETASCYDLCYSTAQTSKLYPKTFSTKVPEPARCNGSSSCTIMDGWTCCQRLLHDLSPTFMFLLLDIIDRLVLEFIRTTTGYWLHLLALSTFKGCIWLISMINLEKQCFQDATTETVAGVGGMHLGVCLGSSWWSFWRCRCPTAYLPSCEWVLWGHQSG